MPDEMSQPMGNPAKKGNMALWIAVAAVVIIGLAAWMFWPKSDSGTTNTTNTTSTNTAGTSLANSSDSNVDDTAQPAGVYQPYAGTWNGAWNNSTFGSTGNMTGTMTVNDDGTAELVLDVNGNVFGLADPAPMTLSGTYTAEALTFTSADHPVFGDLTLRFGSDGQVTGSGLQIPATTIDSLQITGTAAPTGLNMNYTLTAGSATFAQGTVVMTKE